MHTLESTALNFLFAACVLYLLYTLWMIPVRAVRRRIYRYLPKQLRRARRRR